MSRMYFNGVSRISFNGKFLSLVLDDTYQDKSGIANKTTVIELLTELEAAEAICKYLLDEISTIKEMKKMEEKDSIAEDAYKGKDASPTRPPVGSRISVSKYNHSD
ncbi:hypothetical protein N9D19_00795 [Planktomarina temperata]|nr:hypothetical protein [Planktomarina temperata]